MYFNTIRGYHFIYAFNKISNKNATFGIDKILHA